MDINDIDLACMLLFESLIRQLEHTEGKQIKVDEVKEFCDNSHEINSIIGDY